MFFRFHSISRLARVFPMSKTEDSPMHYSGILVHARRESIYDCVRQLTHCPGIDVYTADPATGRVVVVLESGTIEEQEAGLGRVQALSHVVSAELVYHYFGDPEPTPDGAIAEASP